MNGYELSWNVMNCHALSLIAMHCREFSGILIIVHELSGKNPSELNEPKWTKVNQSEQKWTPSEP